MYVYTEDVSLQLAEDAPVYTRAVYVVHMVLDAGCGC